MSNREYFLKIYPSAEGLSKKQIQRLSDRFAWKRRQLGDYGGQDWYEAESKKIDKSIFSSIDKAWASRS